MAEQSVCERERERGGGGGKEGKRIGMGERKEERMREVVEG